MFSTSEESEDHRFSPTEGFLKRLGMLFMDPLTISAEARDRDVINQEKLLEILLSNRVNSHTWEIHKVIHKVIPVETLPVWAKKNRESTSYHISNKLIKPIN